MASEQEMEAQAISEWLLQEAAARREMGEDFGRHALEGLTSDAAVLERAAEIIRDVNAALVEALRAHEAWEGDIILNADWSSGTPRLTQEQIDAVVSVQEKRNAALAAAEPRGEGGRG